MPPRARKLCLLGDSGVGKTALAARLGAVERPSGRGLWVYPWQVPGSDIPCALWDLTGRCSLDSLSQSFLAHADGFALIADAARPDSVALALQAGRYAARLVGTRPTVLILNRFGDTDPVVETGDELPVFVVSASTGEGVEAAFGELARAAGDA